MMENGQTETRPPSPATCHSSGKGDEQVVMATVVKGKATTDELSGLGNSHHVYVDASATARDAALNQTNEVSLLFSSVFRIDTVLTHLRHMLFNTVSTV
jgi:hypothetical protein